MINEENWTYSCYKNDNLKVFISFGGRESLDNKEIEYLYFVTLTDLEHKEIFQSEHLQINEALNIINLKYSNWTFIDSLSLNTSDSGCSSCSAH